MPFFLFIAIVVAIVGGIVYLVKKRRQDLELVARQLKLDFFPKGDESIAPMVSNLDFFMYGERCNVSNLMCGQVKRNAKPVTVAIFDYSYTICKRRSTEFSFNEDSVSIESNSDTETFCQTVLVFYDESLDVPGFSLRPEHIWDKLANFAGYEDINFDRFPAFSKGYRLLSNQVEDVRNLFQPNLIKFYEINKICTEAIGSYLLVFPFPPKHTNSSLTMGDKTFTKSQYLHPKDVKPYLDLSLKLLNLLENNMSAVRS
ncbi:hypothetical protein C7B77_00490 [Chamaesiphon polymorphus CCALA 037]|uniref:DUF3137 domain-containing protein n=1 Tax=Chamaesiphon polymorphus CCALA 037 TaxID=2107692 RepID=A0A2T1GNP8_9CYAN|nr:hypothetical protein C7B77_00490 [Chamaesiphon polymorphus CCALA 037]